MPTNEDAMTLADLIERLEKASGPDREIDASIAGETGWTHMDAWVLSDSYWIAPNDEKHEAVPTYTASLDAALTLLTERQYLFELRQLNADRWYAEIGDIADDKTDGDCYGKTGPLALVTAALKARAAL